MLPISHSWDHITVCNKFCVQYANWLLKLFNPYVYLLLYPGIPGYKAICSNDFAEHTHTSKTHSRKLFCNGRQRKKGYAAVIKVYTSYSFRFDVFFRNKLARYSTTYIIQNFCQKFTKINFLTVPLKKELGTILFS